MHSEVDTVVTGLRARAEEARSCVIAGVATAEGRSAGLVDEATRGIVDELVRRIAARLERAAARGDTAFLDAVRDLFELP